MVVITKILIRFSTIRFTTIVRESEPGPENNPDVMGLLTDPNSGGKGANKVVKLITDYHRPLSWLSYVAGLIFLLGEFSSLGGLLTLIFAV